jgi:hypothetical protein
MAAESVAVQKGFPISLEGTLGIFVEIVLAIMEHLHVREPLIIWGLFVLGILLIIHATIRYLTTNRKRLLGMIPVVIVFSLFGWWINSRMKTEIQRDSKGNNATATDQSPPVTTPPAAVTQNEPKHEPENENKKQPAPTTRAKGTSAQPTFTVSNPTGSIVNQNSPNYGAQIVNNPEPPERNWILMDSKCRQFLDIVKETSATVSIGAFISNNDGMQVVNQLSGCLSKVPGWKVSRAVLPEDADGVEIYAASKDATEIALEKGLTAIGLRVGIVHLLPEAREIDIVVGKRAIVVQQVSPAPGGWLSLRAFPGGPSFLKERVGKLTR